jgi:hypothetical protein
LDIGPNGNPIALKGATLKPFLTAVFLAAVCATPTAAAQGASAPTPDPAPDPAPSPAQPSPDPVSEPQPASSAPGGDETSPPAAQAPPAQPAPAAPAPAAPEPAPAAPEPVAESTPVPASPATDVAPDDSRRNAAGGANGGKAERREKDRSAAVDKVNPIPVLSDVGPYVAGLRDRATNAAPPIAVAALALLTLALTSGGFLVVATRRTGAWRT